jgi:uncharacterized protein YbgA (DUF1722 family)/uncharacterized protein YbbK (DUF523 family)
VVHDCCFDEKGLLIVSEGNETKHKALQEPELRIGVSACLLGQEVRFDGGHKRDAFLLFALDPYVTWVPVCPEVEMGMGIPRETLRLVGYDPSEPRMVTNRTKVDHTQGMKQWSEGRLDQLEDEGLCGYIFKRKSPSCGLFRVKVYAEDGNSADYSGRGLFARALTDRWPLLPVEEEGRLNDPHLRENFIERIFIYQRWQAFLKNNPTKGGLVAFHTRHKMTLLARNEAVYRKMGPLVAQAGGQPWEDVLSQYAAYLAEATSQRTKRKSTTNVLMHLMGFLKQHIDTDDKQELLELIDEYRNGLVPLIVPVTLLKHYFRKYPVPDWVHQQVFLNPYPSELMLRNTI